MKVQEDDEKPERQRSEKKLLKGRSEDLEQPNSPVRESVIYKG